MSGSLCSKGIGVYYAILEDSPRTHARDELPNPGRAVPQKRHPDAFLIKSHHPLKKEKKKKKSALPQQEKEQVAPFGETKKKSALPPRKSRGSGLQRATPQPRLQPCSCNAAGRRAHPFPAFNLMPFPAAAMPSPLGWGVPTCLPAADPLPRGGAGPLQPPVPSPNIRPPPGTPGRGAGRTQTHGGAGK